MMLALALAATLQNPAATAAFESADKEFLALETRLMGAIQRKDAATLEQLLAKGFAYSHMVQGRAPQVLNRDEWIKIRSAQTDLESFEITALSARVFSGVAVVRFQASRKATVGTVDRSGEFGYVDVWIKEGGAWKAANRIASRPDASLPR